MEESRVMKSLLHTNRRWIAGACYIGFLLLTLMVATAVFFGGINLLIEAKMLRIYGSMIWIYFWMYMYHWSVKRCTTWWTLLTEEK